MMTNKKTRSSHLLKLLALVPIIGTALALNARTVTDYVYDEPQKKQIIKKGKANAKINAGNVGEIVVVEQAPKTETKAEDNESFTVRGKVFDDAGKPVIGAVVLIDGSKKGSVTDVNGAFTIKANMGDYLNISYVGLETVRLGVSKMYAKEHEYIIPMSKENASGNKPFDVVEQMPQFPGGPAALMEYLSKNVRYPEEAHKNGVQGRVIATFVVEKDGSITEARIARSVDNLLDAEALRVVNAMPKWTPGMQKGEPVRVKYTIPITFKLQGDAKAKTENIVLGKEHKGKDFSLIIDGKVVDVADLSGISPDNIESMKVEKAKDETSKDRLIITLKKKK
jgi:TonB family protein